MVAFVQLFVWAHVRASPVAKSIAVFHLDMLRISLAQDDSELVCIKWRGATVGLYPNQLAIQDIWVMVVIRVMIRLRVNAKVRVRVLGHL